MTEPEYAVVGAGIVGLSTAFALRERGYPVRVYESGTPGNGQSGGEGRIFRHAHDDPRLVAMAKRSRAIWREWEADLGAELVSGDGVVALGDSALERLAAIEAVGGIGAHEISAEQAAELVPMLAPFDGPAVFDPDGGAIRTSTAIASLSRRLAGSLARDEVLALRSVADGVEVRSGGGSRRYRSVIVTAGRGTPALARTVGLSLPVRQSAHMRITFELGGSSPQRLACLQDGSGTFPESGVYAVAEPGNRRYGVGLSETTDAGDDGSIVDRDGLASLGERTVDYVREALPGLDPRPAGHRHCWVTELPWSADGIAVWEAGGCLFAAGHNLYKMAPALGRSLADAATGERLDEELRPQSRLGRPRD